MQLNFINNIVQPFFSRGNSTDDRQLVSRDKLVNLWINKRRKAIKVIKNNGYWPRNNQVEIPLQENEDYYKSLSKYVICDDFVLVERTRNHINEGKEVVDLSYAEVEKALEKFPNGKAPGIDGVKYEDIKLNWEHFGCDITKIFNLIMVNQKIPTAWKHAIIQRVPKANF